MALTKKSFKTETDKIMEAVEFFYNKQGYVDVPLASKMANVPEMILVNVITQKGYKESGVKGQYIKNE